MRCLLFVVVCRLFWCCLLVVGCGLALHDVSCYVMIRVQCRLLFVVWCCLLFDVVCCVLFVGCCLLLCVVWRCVLLVLLFVALGC